jgi:hypothetical protein
MAYYDFAKVLSYNCFLNLIITNRGLGKSFGFKQWAIRDYLKTGSQFFMSRRFETELDTVKQTYFADIKDKYQDHDFEVSGSNLMIDGNIAGYTYPLTAAGSLKSSAFPNVNKLLLDEFIIEDNMHHYLKNEVQLFLGLLETVFRSRDTGRAFLLSNAVTVSNPYFDYFNLSLPYGSDLYRRDDLLLLHVTTDRDFVQAKKQTKLGRLVDGTVYGDYALDNMFLRDSKTFVAKRTPAAKFQFAIRQNEHLFGVWADMQQQLIYVSKATDPSGRITLSMSTDDHAPGSTLAKNSNPLMKAFLESYRSGCVRFESIAIKNTCMDWIKRQY